MLTLHTLILGPIENNTCILADPITREACVVDPSFDADPILDCLHGNGYHLQTILLTHAHYDHMASAIPLANRFSPSPPIYLHPSDQFLWERGGGAHYFGITYQPSRPVDQPLIHNQILQLGAGEIEIRHTPGHSPGSVILVCHANQLALTGDLIFYHGVGRTDLPGGDFSTLQNSIQTEVFSLPPTYTLIPGHGPSTTVAEEMAENPYI